MSNFSFLEYSFNPHNTTPETLFSSLNRLGFVQRNTHRSGSVSMWTQNQCIILLRQTQEVSEPKVSGLGILVNEETLDEYNLDFDYECSMNVFYDPQGLRILAMPEKQLSKMILHGYTIVDKKSYDTPGLEYFSGLVYNVSNQDTIDFYENIGFKNTKNSKDYDVLMSKNNRFSLLCNKSASDNMLSVVYTDTNDVFKTTCHYTVANFNIKEYNVDKSALNFGADLNYKIRGYNCIAFGDMNRYTIENSVVGAIPNLDFVFRTRKQFLHINEESVKVHYAKT